MPTNTQLSENPSKSNTSQPFQTKFAEPVTRIKSAAHAKQSYELFSELESPLAAASYIHDLSGPLAGLAGLHDLKMLKYFLEMAAMEANEVSQKLQEKEIIETAKRLGPDGE